VNRTEPRAELEEFEKALLSHGSNLLAVATRLARNRSEAEDLVQDTLVKALRAKDQYEAGTNLKAWLLKILKNTFINRYRRSGLERNTLDGPDADPLADGWIGSSTLRAMRDPEAQALRPIIEREINAALESIPEEFRIVVLLADVEELAYKEIADVVGCPIGTVMSRLHRGRRLLKGRLIEQARTLGIATDGPERAEPAEPAAAPPVELKAYRAKRGAS
jgi:RNA polymerase sigma-70 factor (ECF subfamily)